MSTRPKRVRYFLLSCMLLSLPLPSSAFAELATSETSLLPNAPLMITSYQTTQNGNDIQYIELFNNSDELIDLTQWNIIDVANTRTFVMSTQVENGYLRPETHIVASCDDVVGGATYTIENCGPTYSSMLPLNTLTVLRLESDGYRSSDLTIKAAGAQEIRNFGVSSYLTSFTEGSSRLLFDGGLYVAPVEPDGLVVTELYAYASDCSPLDDSVLCGDFIELRNMSSETIDLEGLVVRTDSSSSSRTSSNTFSLSGYLEPGEYLLVNETDDGGRISLTNSGGYVWLEDTWGLMTYSGLMTEWPSFGSSQQGLGYALYDDTWQWTASPTPGFANEITEPVVVLAACPAGKYRNPETGRCRSIEEAVNELSACQEGYERNPATNRCRKIASTTSTLVPCKEGYERNPATNRCRSIASAVAELIPCDEGYERNPATNRCRKVQADAIPGAPFAVEQVAADVPAWQWWVGGAIAAGLAGYAIWEWRHEIAGIGRHLFKR